MTVPPSPDHASGVPSAPSPAPAPAPAPLVPPAIARWVKSECGREKYRRLAQRSGLGSRLRLWWFVAIAALRDWRLPAAD